MSYKEYVDSEFEPLIPAYIENKYKEVQMLKEYCVNQNIEKLKYLGHRIKGSGMNYGFEFISELGIEVECLAHENRIHEIEALIEKFEKYLREVEVVYIEI